jgi:hypothetical protein
MSYGTNKPWGLMPVRYQNGAAWNDQKTPYLLPSGYAANLFKYDPATPDPAHTGKVKIAIAGDGNVVLGAFVGFQWVDANTGEVVFSDRWISGTVTQGGLDAVAFIADDPMLVFNMQVAGNTNTILTQDLLRNISLAAGAGDTYSKLSGWYINQSTINTGSTLQMKILRFVPTSDGTNVSGLPYNNVECLINNHYYKAGVASV